jgi:hypothetical protein
MSIPLCFAGTKKTKFNVDDFMIKNFGIDKDGFPFINVKVRQEEQYHRRKIPDMLISL